MSALNAQLNRLRQLRADQATHRDALIRRAEAAGLDELDERSTKQFRQFTAAIDSLDERIADLQDEVARSGRGDRESQAVRKATAGVNVSRGPAIDDDGPYGKAPPLRFDPETLRHAHQMLRSGSAAQFESRGFISGVDALIPPTLYPQVVGQVHENRILDRIPAQSIDAPSIEFIRHISSTGSPGVTAEGALKPEVTMNFDRLIATLVKVAGHSAISYEVISDFDNFAMYVGTELTRQVIDQENLALLSGPGGAGQVEGLLNTSGTLSHVAGQGTTGITPLDDVEVAIAQLRTGPALADPDLFIVHPDTWSSLRRTKDSMGRYLLSADPTQPEANNLWGVDVLQTTQIAAGTGILVDTQRFGRAIIRGPIMVLVGFANDDFTRNLRRFVAEERISLATTRPAAVNVISGLPVA